MCKNCSDFCSVCGLRLGGVLCPECDGDRGFFTVQMDYWSSISPISPLISRASIRSADGHEIENFDGPASDDWLPEMWDAVLLENGYERVGEWDDFNLRCTARRL